MSTSHQSNAAGGSPGDIRCPACLGSQYEVISPGRYRCTNPAPTSAVPPGAGGNIGSAPIPLYCDTEFTEQPGIEAGRQHAENQAAKRRRQDEEAAWTAAEKDLKQRKAEALAALNAAGNPGLVARRVPGRYHLTFMRKLLQQVGTVEPVDTEPAWPVGPAKWYRRGKHGEDRKEKLLTGITPTGRLVPMEHGASGDVNVEGLYQWWQKADPRFGVTKPSLTDIVAVLEGHLGADPES